MFIRVLNEINVIQSKNHIREILRTIILRSFIVLLHYKIRIDITKDWCV